MPKSFRVYPNKLEADYSIHTLSTCSECGYLNPDNAKFCQQCGEPLASPLTTEQVSETPLTAEAPTKRGMTGVEKAVLVGAVLVMILVVGVFASMSYNPSRTAPNPTPATPSWHAVTSFSGECSVYNQQGCSLTTDTFTIRGSEFRFRWQYNATDLPQYVTFSVFVYPQGKNVYSGSYVDFMCRTGDIDDTVCHSYALGLTSNAGYEYVSPGQGNYYGHVISGNVRWSIAVEDYY